MQSLSSVKAGEACEIKWMFGAPAVLEFLSKFGIKEGSRIRVLERSRNDMIILNLVHENRQKHARIGHLDE